MTKGTILLAIWGIIWCGSGAFAQNSSIDDVEVQAVGSEKEVLSKKSTETTITPLSQRGSLKQNYEGVEFDSTADLRARRRVGLGLQTMGPVGLLGMMLELNFQPQNSLLAGYGGGPGYSAFNFQWRHVFLAEKISPYTGLGYARWNSASKEENFKDTTPSILGARMLTDEEKTEGRFGMDLLTSNVGLMYQFLRGPYTGLALFGELDLLVRVSKMTLYPLGSVGATFYF